VQAARDLDVAESVLRRWIRELTATSTAAFPGNGQIRADQAMVVIFGDRKTLLFQAVHPLRFSPPISTAQQKIVSATTRQSPSSVNYYESGQSFIEFSK